MATPNALRSDIWVTTATGVSIVGAHVYWLTQPANVPNAEPSPSALSLATDFTDGTATLTVAQPVVTDGFGHAAAYLSAGQYTIAVYVNGFLFQVYPDQNVAQAPASGVSTFNALIGAITLVGGTNMSVVTAGNTLTFNYTASLGVTSLNGLATNTPSITAGSSISVTPSGSNIQITYTAPALPSALNGDTIRWNVNNDTKWDAGPYGRKTTIGVATSSTATISMFGYLDASFLIFGGTLAAIAPTATQSYGLKQTTSSALTVTIGIIPYGWFASSTVTYNIMCWFAQTMTFSMASVGTNARYYWGMSVFNTGASLGNNNTGIVNTANYATDTPNKATVGWRFSAGTDTTIKAVTIVAGASPSTTVVDTGFTPDTNVHTYEMVQNNAGTSVTFYIDGVSKATISTNLPSATPANANDALASSFLVSDNKNSANLCGHTFYNSSVSWRG